ncbi:L,D-transpeptidase family protein [Myxococcota bacterium]|nr:L,D-transpeptidase family protein [Myxococcota bacterium]
MVLSSLPLLLLACSSPGAASSGEEPPSCADTVQALPSAPGLDPADPRLSGPALVVVEKGARRVAVYQGGALAAGACWPVGLAWGAPAGPKRRRGDMKTPEGWYRTSDKPWSQFYGAIAVHYPAAHDATWGREQGLLSQGEHDRIVAALRAGRKPDQGTAMGGEILLHGGGGDRDWTLGCVALDDPDLDRLRALLPATMGTDLLILP